MKVLLVLGTSAGGVGRHVQGLARLLAGAGHLVMVAAPAAVAETFALGEHATVSPVEVTDRPHPRRDARAIRDLVPLVAGADVVHAHGLRAGAVAVLAAARSRTPVVTTLHNAAPTGLLTGAVYAGLERVVARGSRVVLGVSADLVQRMEALGAAHTALAVVPAPPRRLPSGDRYTVHGELGLDARTCLGVVLARLAPQKGLDLLLDAHRDLRDLDLVTVVAGDGPLRARLQARIDAERLPVRLLGVRDDVPDLLAAADVVVSSAVWEGQPVGLQEALHAGAAIVATDVGGTHAVVGDAAILVPGGDPVSLSRGIRDVVTHGGVRDDLRSKAVERAGELPSEADALAAAETAYALARTGS
ncbi:glycosyltransferase family 4 protein [Phycicoccus duodecadis]|uniref:Glycosyltransferase involved in cell wall biosynthesis n=1 Tax=Phycicoccus duodecadis TaxID=173053 RepID=A0A2N3YN85_9MICO|nr:glycosyltransferase family 4 protein [Phycicoccus duodecadis]PKW28315.1 glycosyltransferase involved in cell wall biosynthesis [Phycicoccus duodecadis]